MGKGKTSIIWEIPKGEFQRLVDESSFVVDILEKLGLPKYNGNHKTFYARVEEDNISLDKFIENHRRDRKKLMKNLNQKVRILDEDFFVKGVHRNNRDIKARLLKSGEEYRCADCGNEGFHNNKSLSLQIDHINGDRDDNRRENLQLLCPNCHSQTDTFSGKNAANFKAPREEQKYYCPKCGEEYAGYGAVCHKCIQRNCSRPDKEALNKLVWGKPLRDIGSDYGVSDVAVRKWCKYYGLEVPPRGYWLRSGVSKEI